MQSYEVNVAQVDAEFSRYVAVLKQEKVTSYLEIGSKFGGSLWRAAQALKPGARIVAVDMPNGTKAWSQSSMSLKACIAKLCAMGFDARVIWGNSTDTAVIAQVKALGPYDAAFIDADHRLPGVTADWRNYGPMARIVAFHDIAWTRAKDWVGTRIDVPQFWDGIKGGYSHEEFKFCPTGKNNGIGVLWRD
jgi:cephalosporin hydroxylase